METPAPVEDGADQRLLTECVFCQRWHDEIFGLLEDNRALKCELGQRKMDEHFLKNDNVKVKYYTMAVILDCFEIFIQRPSNLKAHARSYSHYKHNTTMKYLIGITPQGPISFISKGWGGHVSDKHITDNCGILDKLLPADLMLSDRGFDIQDSLGLMCDKVEIPAFTKGCFQLDARDVESTRNIAYLRIHVERMIGTVRNKYTILSDKVPIHMLLPCKVEDMTFLDKIVSVCCALTNISPSVVLK